MGPSSEVSDASGKKEPGKLDAGAAGWGQGGEVLLGHSGTDPSGVMTIVDRDSRGRQPVRHAVSFA